MSTQQRQARRRARQRAQRNRRLAALATGLAVLAIALALAVGAGTSKHNKRLVSSRTSVSGSPARAHPNLAPPRSTIAATVNRRAARRSVPILMYHVIKAPPAGAPFPGLYVTPSEFAAQMQALAASGYHAVTMDEMLANWTRGAPLPAGKPVVLSFDNGYQSQYTQALPVLRRLGWVGVENLQLSGLPPSQGGLSHTQVRGLLEAGWELDTQGYSHADLITLDAAALHYQVAVARTEIQRLYHVSANWFCYPSGHYDAAVIAAVRGAGYSGSTTVVPGWASRHSDPYRLPRLRVLGGTSPEALLSLISSVRSAQAPPPSYGSA
jgi:peptidoglycan/xylan/chitin deacetylase (PgdA/CDA1 family)